MPTYKIEKKTGNERYNITVPRITKEIPVDFSGVPQEMVEFMDKKRVVKLGSVELKNVTGDVARAIMMLCESANIPMTLEIIETPNTAST